MIKKYFAFGSILFLLMLVVVGIDNYNREWKGYQRRYWIENLTQRAKEQKGAELNVWERLLVLFKAEQNLQVARIVTEEWRGADLCMTCHIDVGKLMAQHSKLVVEQLPFDQVGCTACHGGDPLALTVKGAHKGLRDQYEKIFEESLKKLNSELSMTRQKAIEQIRWMTGNDFGFSFSDPPEKRAQAMEGIKAWWELHKDIFITERFGKRTEPFTLKNPKEELVEKRTDVSLLGEELKFIGSATCIACHANPQISDVYIPESSKEHVERWFNENFMTSKNIEAFKDHPFIDEEILKTMDVTCEACHGPGSGFAPLMMKGLALQNQSDPLKLRAQELRTQVQKIRDQAQALEAQRKQKEKEGLKAEAEKLKAEETKLKSEAAKLEEEATKLDEEASRLSTEAASIIARAKEIARSNARKNISDPRIWRIFEKLIEEAIKK